MTIKITAKGLEYEINELIFDNKNSNICLIYGQNGIGKSILTKVIKAISDNSVNSNDDIENNFNDKINVKKPNLDELKKNLRNKKTKIIDNSLFDNNSVIIVNDQKIIIQRNAEKIQNLEKEINNFKENINTKNSFLKGTLIEKFGEKTQFNIYKYFKIKKNSFNINNFNKKNKYSSKVQDVLVDFESQDRLTKSLNLFEKISKLDDKRQKIISNLESKYEISLKNIEAYHELNYWFQKHNECFKNNQCPICLSNINLQKCFDDIKKEIDIFLQNDKKNLMQLKKEWFELELNNIKNIEWNDEISKIFLNKINGFYIKYKDANFNDEAQYFIAVQLDICDRLNYHQLMKLKDNLPELNKKFENKFKKSINESLSLQKDEIDWKIENNKIVFNSKKPEVKVKDILSTSSKKILSICYALSTINDEKIIVFDDPTDSNDYLNMGFLIRQIKLIAQKHKIVIFTHDIELIKLIEEFVNKDKKNSLITKMTSMEKIQNKIKMNQEPQKINTLFSDMLDLYDRFKKTDRWQFLIIFAILFRIMGKNQEIIKFKRSSQNIKYIKKILWIETSNLMHYNNINDERIKKLWDELQKILLFSNKQNQKMIFPQKKIKTTKNLIDELILFYESSNKLKKILPEILLNVLRAIRNRIIFEAKYLKNQDSLPKPNEISEFGSYTKKKFDSDSPKNKNLVPFHNKYWNILNNLIHFYENDYYKFIAINKSILDEMDRELKNID